MGGAAGGASPPSAGLVAKLPNEVIALNSEIAELDTLIEIRFRQHRARRDHPEPAGLRSGSRR
jgi:hypothetical protein